MIAKLKGFVDSVSEDCCILDVNGVGYLVYASSRTLSKLNPGQEATLHTIMTVREDDISLFGFIDLWEKEWFGTLTKVQGVGSKVCLSILSALAPSQLSAAISAQDKTSFCRANGVGPKLAARIVTELKDKVVSIPVLSNSTDVLDDKENAEKVNVAPQQNVDWQKSEDVISALVNLGYQRIEAYHAATKVISENENADISTLIRLALKEFARKDF